MKTVLRNEAVDLVFEMLRRLVDRQPADDLENRTCPTSLSSILTSMSVAPCNESGLGGVDDGVADRSTAAAPLAAHFPFGLQPVFEIAAVLPATCLKQLMGPTGDLVGILLVVNEQKLMLIEVRQPLLPADWPETRDSWEVEPETRGAVIDRHSSRSGRRRFSGRRFSLMQRRPAADACVISRRLYADAGSVAQQQPGHSGQPIARRES
jgi:hypothetical protein